MSEHEYSFIVTGPLELEESFGDRAILTGKFLKLNSATKNGRIYSVEEGNKIAQGLMGMPIYFGAKIGFDPLMNKIGFKHLRDESSLVGRVIKTIFNKVEETISGAVEVWNTTNFPDLISQIKKGWGFSIGGEIERFLKQGIKNALGNEIMKIFGMKPTHLQLLSPKIPRGQEEAQVEDIEAVEESLMFDPCPWGLCEINHQTEEIAILDETSGNRPNIQDEILSGKIPIIRRQIKIFINEDPDTIIEI